MIGPGEICISWVHGGTVRAEFMDTILGVIADPVTGPLVGRYVTYSAGCHVAVARNAATVAFLAGGREPWLFMIDTDITFEPVLFRRLAAAADEVDRPVLSGVYWLPDPDGPPVPVIYHRRPGRDPEFRPVENLPDAKIIKVGGVGAGCVMIHRRVFEDIAKNGAGPWWSELPAAAPGTITGEDLSFCKRAAAAGYPIHADTGARCGHVKSVVIGPP